jgi:hypothetical protein
MELMLTMSATCRGPSLAALSRCGRADVGGVEQPLGVDGDHAVPLLWVRAEHGAKEHQAGVVDRSLQTAEPLDGPLHGGLRLAAVGDVSVDHERGAA